MQIDDCLGKELEGIEQAGLWRQMETADDFPSAAKIVINGRQMINLCSNNYLGLSAHPEVKKAACEAVGRWGCGAGASRLMAGHTRLHQRLEEKIAEFKQTEAALVYPSGYMANLGIISALAGPNDTVYSDKLNHASIIDGIMLSRARLKRYRHNDMAHLKELLERDNGQEKGEEQDNRRDKKRYSDGRRDNNINEDENKNGRKLIITDTVFSMDGDMALLPEMIALAKQYNCWVMVDEAHAAGVLGARGRGAVEHFGLEGQIDIQIGTLSKALGGQGGYAAGSRQLIDYLVNTSRNFIFTTGLSPAMAGAALKALDIIREDFSFRDKLLSNVKYFRERMKTAGFDLGQSRTQIIPVMIGDARKAVEFSRRLNEAGVFARPVRPPAVPKGTARIRVSLTAGHSQPDLEQAAEVFIKIGRGLGLI